MITKKTFEFLKSLSKNNSKEWMDANRSWYLDSKEEIVSFADDLIGEMFKHDDLETVSGKKSIYRINRDIRFSKNKKLYKSHFAGRFQRASEALRGGYYFHIQPGNSFLAGGFFGPSPEDLKHIRKQIEITGDELKELLNKKGFKSYFGELYGNKVKTSPRGFSSDDPNIELIRYKQFLLTHQIDDKMVMSQDFHKYVSDGFKNMRPFLDYMSEILTTDLNGVSKI